MSTAIASRTTKSDLALLLARILLASLFVFSGLQKALHYNGAVDWAASHGISFAAYLMWAVIALELGASALVVSGWHAREGAWALMLWVLWTGFWFHRFWDTPPQMWQIMVDDFFHHLVMAGGFLYVAVCGPGSVVLRRHLHRADRVSASGAIRPSP
jgi:putative oxidoreductase